MEFGNKRRSRKLIKMFVEGGYTPFEACALIEQGVDTDVLYTKKNSRTTYSLLYCAAREGDVESVKALLALGMKPAADPSSPRSSLQAAITSDKTEIISLLLDHGADINAITEGRPPLIHALYDRKTEAVLLLIRRGADWKTQKFLGQTILTLAACRGNAQVVRALIDMGADTGSADLKRILNDSGDEEAEMLIRAGAPFDKATMACAARRCMTLSLSAMLDAGASPDTEYDGTTLLEVAVSHPDKQVLNLLIDAGADVDAASSKNGWTPATLAAAQGHPDVISLLAAAGANMEKPGRDALTPLQWAEQRKKPDTAEAIRAVIGSTEKNLWQPVDADRVVHVETIPALETTVRDVFNFKSRERLILTTNHRTGAEAAAHAGFDATDPALLAAAHTAFTRHGGVAALDAVLNRRVLKSARLPARAAP